MADDGIGLNSVATNKAPSESGLWLSLAEAVGFEPTVPFGTTVFKTASLSHSDTPPRSRASAVARRT